MVTLKNWLQLIRWKNLLFLAYIVTAIFYGVVMPYLSQYNLRLENDIILYLLLMASTVFIAAGGYITTIILILRLMKSTALHASLLAIP